MYLNPKVTELLNKIKPVQLQEDLRQELAMVLLNYDCKKIIKINKEGNLLGFTLRILWVMGTGTKGEFFNKYKRTDLIDNVDYYNSIYGNNTYPDEDLSNLLLTSLIIS